MKTKKFPGGKTQFDVSKTPVGKMKLPPKKVSPEVQKKTFDAFKKEMLRMAMSIQGSGWVYLARNGSIKKTPNQSYKTDILMPIDMWEHSFSDYTKEGKECKKKYLTSTMKLINWEVINNRLQSI